MVRKERLELSRLAALEPKSSASTNSATFALIKLNAVVRIITSPLPKPADFTPACLTSWYVFKGLSADICGSQHTCFILTAKPTATLDCLCQWQPPLPEL